MSRLESSETIEAMVGAPRQEDAHLGRAVSAEQRVYVLHSQRCVDAHRDLRTCPYSVALDEGIDLDIWQDYQDRPVELAIDEDHFDLVPLRSFTGAAE